MKKGTISKTGYRTDSKDRYNAFNVIPSNNISMVNVPHPVLGIDNLGNKKMMLPGEDYIFPGQYVTEIPTTMKNKNFVNPFVFQQGGPVEIYNPRVDGNVETVWDNPIYQDKFKNKSFHSNVGIGTGIFDASGKEYSDAYFTLKDRFRNLFKPNQDKITPVFKQGGVPCFDCGGGVKMQGGGNWIQDVTQSIERRGTKGRCTGDSFGGPDCPKGSPQYNLAVTFRKMAQKQLGGMIADQNSDTDSFVDQRRNKMQNFLSKNALSAIAMQEADELSDAFMQMGGNFGFNPNMYNQSMYADAASQGKNQMHRDFGDFFNSGINAVMTADPYMQMNIRQMGGDVYYPPVDSAFASTVGADYQNYLQFKNNNIDLAQYIEQGQPIPTYLDLQNIQQNQQGQMSRYGQMTKPASLAITGIRQPAYGSQGMGSSSGNTGSTGSSSGTPVNNSGSTQTGVAPQSTEPRQGNYTGPSTSQTLQNNENLYYVPGQQNQQLAFMQGSQPYGYFPINTSPYFKVNGRGSMFAAGIPNIAYNPNETFLKEYEYKGRLLGQGPRKVKMTFQHGVPTYDAQGNVISTGTGVGAGNTTPSNMPAQYPGPNQNLDVFLEQNMDPGLYSRVLEGDATEQDYINFNEEKMRLENQFNRSPLRQINPGLSAEPKSSLKTRMLNFQQNLEEKAGRRKFRKNPPRESGVHPGFAQKQLGGGLSAEDMTAFDASARAGYHGPVAGQDDETTIIWKRKMGIDPENAVAWGLTGMNALSSYAEMQEARKNEELMRQRMNADALFQPIQAGDVSRGDYEVNTGAFRPDQMVPVQFQGNNFGQIASGNTYRKGGPVYNAGGEYYLTDEQIRQIMKKGGTVKYLY